MDRLEGVVSWFDEKKGIGFIKSQGKDYFLHYGDIMIEGFKVVYKDDVVSFKPESTPRGVKATMVTPLRAQTI